jgi:hypothetical protein
MRASVGSKGGGGITGTSPRASKAREAPRTSTTSTGLTKATKKDLIDTKAFAGVSSSIDKVSESTHVASDTAKQYAGMMGIAVDKNGVAAVSAKTLATAVSTVSKAYANASQSGDEYLKALNTFSGRPVRLRTGPR